MELFERLRLRIGKARLEKKTAEIKRKRSFSNLTNVKRIGLVWDASHQEDFGKIAAFTQKMNNRDISVDIIGYYPDKLLPDKYTAIRYLKCFKRQDLNMFYIPVINEPLEFIKTEFDVLIDLNFKAVFPLRYVTVLSSARFKVGLSKQGGDDPHIDLLIQLNDTSDIELYFSQVLLYLEMIHGSENSVVSSNPNIKPN